jgi:hypothetical protein
MDGEAGRSPVPSARNELAEQRDVGVVAAQEPLVERLGEPPQRRRRGAGEDGSAAAAQKDLLSTTLRP